jgi:hypothetical protein
MALMVRTAGVTLDPATSAALFLRLGEMIGATPGDSDEVLTQKLAEYYRAHPPRPELERAVDDPFKSARGIAAASPFDAVAAQKQTDRHEPIAAKPIFEVHDPERK